MAGSLAVHSDIEPILGALDDRLVGYSDPDDMSLTVDFVPVSGLRYMNATRRFTEDEDDLLATVTQGVGRPDIDTKAYDSTIYKISRLPTGLLTVTKSVMTFLGEDETFAFYGDTLGGAFDQVFKTIEESEQMDTSLGLDLATGVKCAELAGQIRTFDIEQVRY